MSATPSPDPKNEITPKRTTPAKAPADVIARVSNFSQKERKLETEADIVREFKAARVATYETIIYQGQLLNYAIEKLKIDGGRIDAFYERCGIEKTIGSRLRQVANDPVMTNPKVYRHFPDSASTAGEIRKLIAEAKPEVEERLDYALKLIDEGKITPNSTRNEVTKLRSDIAPVQGSAARVGAGKGKGNSSTDSPTSAVTVKPQSAEPAEESEPTPPSRVDSVVDRETVDKARASFIHAIAPVAQFTHAAPVVQNVTDICFHVQITPKGYVAPADQDAVDKLLEDFDAVVQREFSRICETASFKADYKVTVI